MIERHRQHRAACARTRGGGFTLLELVVVLAILVLMASLVPPLVSSAVPGAELKGAARELAAALRNARSQAITRNREVTVHLNVKTRRYRVTGHKQAFSLPDDLKLSVYGASSESPSAVIGGIRFFPDGSSTGGRITVAKNGLTYQVNVDWLLGRVKLGELDENNNG